VSGSKIENKQQTTDRKLQPVELVLLQLKKISDASSSERVTQIACGGYHTAALTTLGRVYVWVKK
jgi:alpha-tubulin suppressor-like RCC1 family protein